MHIINVAAINFSFNFKSKIFCCKTDLNYKETLQYKLLYCTKTKKDTLKIKI